MSQTHAAPKIPEDPVRERVVPGSEGDAKDYETISQPTDRREEVRSTDEQKVRDSQVDDEEICRGSHEGVKEDDSDDERIPCSEGSEASA